MLYILLLPVMSTIMQEKRVEVLTCEDCGLFQPTGTRTLLEVEPEEVEEVLRVNAMALVFPSRPGEPCRSSYRRPITGVYQHRHKQTGTCQTGATVSQTQRGGLTKSRILFAG